MIRFAIRIFDKFMNNLKTTDWYKKVAIELKLLLFKGSSINDDDRHFIRYSERSTKRQKLYLAEQDKKYKEYLDRVMKSWE